MSTASTLQVGGNHYAAEYQHWDWAEEIGLGNMEYAATKYITRWRRKDGLQDLKKARSYVAKLMELHTNKSRVNPAVCIPGAFDRFCTQNNVSGRERDVCLILNYWSRYSDLESVLVIIRDIILDNFPEEGQAKISTGNPFNQTVVKYDPNEGDEDATIIDE